jgi:hypothetical protein
MSSTEPTRPADLERVVGDEPADELLRLDERSSEDERSIEEADRRNGEPGATASPATPRTPAPGTDTATGTDPDATYDQPGYEDKSFGQAVDQDRALVDDLLEATDGDEAEAAARFERESAGRTTLHRQQAAGSDGPTTSS